MLPPGSPPTPRRSGTGMGEYNLDIHAQWPPESPAAPHVAWARAARQAAQRASAGVGYVNFIGADQGPDPVRAAYGGNYPGWPRSRRPTTPTTFPHQPQHPTGSTGGDRADSRPAAADLRQHLRSDVPSAPAAGSGPVAAGPTSVDRGLELRDGSEDARRVRPPSI